MPEIGAQAALAFRHAQIAVETRLREEGVDYEPLTTAAIAAAYPTRHFISGWRVKATFSDSEVRRIDILLSPAFPIAYARTALVDRPEKGTWPHIEGDGILCLLPVMAEIDASDPAAVTLNLLGRSARLVDELIEGKIVDRDFREEFLTYWFYSGSTGSTRVQSLIRPEPPSRVVRVWRDDGCIVVGEDDAALERWLRNCNPERGAKRRYRSEPACFIWLGAAPIPSDYPITGGDILALAADDQNRAILAEAAATARDDLLVVASAEGRGGPGLIAMMTTSAQQDRSRSGRVEKPLTKGFREAGLAAEVAITRIFSARPILRLNVDRADPMWIHGRGRDPRTAKLLSRSCTIIGCGSIGSSVAARLARAGVGRIRLVDHDKLEWSNLGRHELGAGSIGRNKAEDLAARLSADFPHLDIAGFDRNSHMLIEDSPELLLESDLVIAATGSWRADGDLNRWHIAQGRPMPILYGWTESYAAASHAVIVTEESGCLRCGISATGIPTFAATSWPDGATLEEPACGNHFHPYGAVELGFVIDHIADAALTTLLTPSIIGVHDFWVTSAERTAATGGSITPDAAPLLDPRGYGGRAQREWKPSTECPCCAVSAAKGNADVAGAAFQIAAE